MLGDYVEEEEEEEEVGFIAVLCAKSFVVFFDGFVKYKNTLIHRLTF